jgi:hypothetical protein
MTEARIQVGPERTATDIVLYGFPEEWVATLQEIAQSLDLRSEEPPIYRFENVTYLRAFGRLYDENGRIIEETRMRRGAGLARARGEPKLQETIAIPPETRRVAEPVLYGGQLRAHWGHFLTEGISRLWALQSPEVEPSMPVFFDAPKHLTVPFIESFLRHAGIGEDRLLVERRAVTFEHMLVPHPSFSLRGQAFSCHAALPERVGRAIAGETSAVSDEAVYLSRRLLPREKMRPFGEEELEAALRTKAVRIVSPETLTFEDQVRLVHSHTTFIGRLGSAFHSLLYELPGRPLRTGVLGGTVRSYVNFFMVDYLKGINASYIFDASGREGSPAHELDRLVERLQELTLI